jgi:hypothetical protein
MAQPVSRDMPFGPAWHREANSLKLMENFWSEMRFIGP